MPSSYVLTPTARRHLREAKAWSMARWGRELTAQYFHDIEKIALHLAEHHYKHENGLGIYPVREHYIVYEPLAKRKIAIVAFVRQGRDVPALLSRYGAVFERELEKIRKKVH
jgi:plasmid stabilization system protein ParE